MGMPTLPAYLIIVLVLGNAMKRLGIPDIAVHLFVFYFGVLSAITPPVALAAVAAAPIANAEPVRTGIAAIRLSLVGFIIPFVFVYNPSLLLVVDGFHWPEFLWALLRLLTSIWLLNSAFSGFDYGKLPMWSRAVRLAAGLIVFVHFWEIQLAAESAGIAVIVLNQVLARRRNVTAQASEL